MKLILLILALAVITVNAQDKSKIIIDEKSEKPMLVGITGRQALQDTSFAWWFNSEYETYEVKTADLENVSGKIKDFDITIVMGTWCSDSRREIPRFYKILDSLNYPSDKVKLIMVDRNRKGLNGEADSLGIELVPTIIFYHDGRESGRITEAPKETLEKDTYNIIEGKNTDSEK
ncbi:MAG: thioredoxin family protein [Ignavibacteriales bacterium]